MQLKEKERYVRWQDYRITQLSFSINLFLGFAIASLAYAINLKLGESAINNDVIVFVVKCWSFSAILGCCATVSRLLDFRFTARKIKFKDKVSNFMAKHLGAVTWGLFWGQIITYVSGAFCFIINIIN